MTFEEFRFVRDYLTRIYENFVRFDIIYYQVHHDEGEDQEPVARYSVDEIVAVRVEESSEDGFEFRAAFLVKINENRRESKEDGHRNQGQSGECQIERRKKLLSFMARGQVLLGNRVDDDVSGRFEKKQMKWNEVWAQSNGFRARSYS